MLRTLQQKHLKKYLILFIGVLLFSPSISFGATISVKPEIGEYREGDTFLVELFVDTEGERINVVDVELIFPADVLEVEDVSSGNSIVNLWLEKPTFSNKEGIISFVGGVPGSYTGKNGRLGSIVFTVRQQIDATDTVRVDFTNNTKLLQDDYKGTEATLRTRGALLTISAEQSSSNTNEWDERLRSDTIPPEPFRIEIATDPQIFSGDYFAVFSTTDKQSGMERYEVKEGGGEWMRAESPYVLKNQSSNKEIMVRAIDKAGNERIQMIQFVTDDVHDTMNWKYALFSLSFFLLLGGVLLRAGILYKRRKNMSTL